MNAVVANPTERARFLEAEIARLEGVIEQARQAGADASLIARVEGKALAYLEEYEAIVEWSRACNGRPFNRARIARYLLSDAWRRGDMAAVLELAEQVEGVSVDTEVDSNIRTGGEPR